MIITPLAVRSALSQDVGGLIGPGLGAMAAVVAAAADMAGSQPEASVLTIIASVLGATGVIGWGFRQYVTTQIARSEDQRKLAAKERAEEREEDRQDRERQRQEAAELLRRYFEDRAARETYLVLQVDMWQKRADAERERCETFVKQFLSTSHDDAL